MFRSAIALLILVIAPSACPADLVTVALVPGTLPATVDLTSEGTQDWVLFGTDTFASGLGSPMPDEEKLGGSDISDLSLTPVNSFADNNAGPSFEWTDGTTITASSMPTSAMLVTRGNGPGSSLSFTVAAPAGEKRRLQVYTQAFRSTGTLTATLTGANDAQTYTAGTTDVPGMFVIDFEAMTPQTLSVEFLLTNPDLGSTAHSVGIGAVSLVVIPEPHGFAMLGMIATTLAGYSRYRRRN